MSKRNDRAEKKINKLRKALRENTTTSYIDLVQWLLDHKEANTSGEAKRIIAAGRVKADSHVLGLTKVPLEDGKELQIPTRLVSSRYRGSISVTPAT